VFVDIVLVFGNHFVSNNGVGVEKLAMFAIRDPKKIDFQKLLGGNHILNIEVTSALPFAQRKYISRTDKHPSRGAVPANSAKAIPLPNSYTNTNARSRQAWGRCKAGSTAQLSE